MKIDTPCDGLRIKQQDRPCTQHVTMCHVRLTIGIVEKQRWLNFVLLSYEAFIIMGFLDIVIELLYAP